MMDGVELAAAVADRDAARSEADVQAAIRDLLVHGGIDLGDEQVRLEAATSDGGRIDIEVGRAVIEVKRDLRQWAWPQLRDQIGKYLREREKTRGVRHVGVVTDGYAWHAFLLDPGEQPQQLAETVLSPGEDPGRLLVWLEAMLATRQQIPATAAEITKRLGRDSSSYQADLVELEWVYEEVAAREDVELKRKLWGQLLSIAFGTALDADEIDARRLFLDHTYLVTLASLIGHRAVGEPIVGVAPRQLLAGEAFHQAGIRGVIEHDFFAWVADTDAGVAWVERLARKIARFDWGNVEHDVLKALYQSVIDAETRHRLGEYYTPDWLASLLIDDVVDEPHAQRVLDPACGSGTFLFHAARASLEGLEERGASTAEAISSTVARVYGMDVHPVAVALARVTYLLAIGTDRLAAGEHAPFAVPVYLGDSMRYDTASTEAVSEGTLLSSSAGAGLVVHLVTDNQEVLPEGLRFPESVLDEPTTFDQLVTEIAEAARDRPAGAAAPNLHARYAHYGVIEGDWPVLDHTLGKLCELVDEGKDDIWGYYARNLARPFWLSQPAANVDRLVGNVPWLAYRFMPDEVAKAFRRLSQPRGLWVGAKQATQQDLSALFVARSVEQYLQHGGRFGFLTPRSVLTSGAYKGFRRALWTDGNPDSSAVTVQFDPAWDLDRVRDLFPVPAAAVRGTRVPQPSDAEPLPEETEVVLRAADGEVRFDPGSTAATHALPVGDASVYADEFRNGATIFPSVLTRVELVPSTGGLSAPMGTLRVRSARSGQEDPPWSALHSLEDVVPDQFVFGLYVGKHVVPFLAREPGHTVLPFEPGQGRLLSDDELDAHPRLAKWWRTAEQLYETHASGKIPTLRDRVNYHKSLAVQATALDRLRVVYTASGTYVAAAIVHDPRGVIEHKLYWRAVESENEGFYLCGILNAPFTIAAIRHLQSRGLFGPRDIDKLVFELPWPTFDPTDPAHLAVVETAYRCRDVAAEVPGALDAHFVTARKRIRKALDEQGLTAELNERVAALLGTAPEKLPNE